MKKVLQYFCMSHRGNVWLGLEDRETEGVFKWPNGAMMSYDFWDGGEPNSDPGGGIFGEQDCAFLNSNGEEVADKTCSDTRQSLCSTVGRFLVFTLRDRRSSIPSQSST